MLSESALRPRHEILYHLSSVLSQCVGPPASENCVALYRLSLANSGRDAQALVQVRWPAGFSGWQIDWASSDLVASQEPRADAEISAAKGAELGHDIRNLAPNTLIEFTVRCLQCTRAQLEAAQQAAVQVDARGKVVDREPRMTLLGRAATNAARVVGIFF